MREFSEIQYEKSCCCHLQANNLARPCLLCCTLPEFNYKFSDHPLMKETFSSKYNNLILRCPTPKQTNYFQLNKNLILRPILASAERTFSIILNCNKSHWYVQQQTASLDKVYGDKYFLKYQSKKLFFLRNFGLKRIFLMLYRMHAVYCAHTCVSANA